MKNFNKWLKKVFQLIENNGYIKRLLEEFENLTLELQDNHSHNFDNVYYFKFFKLELLDESAITSSEMELYLQAKKIGEQLNNVKDEYDHLKFINEVKGN